MPGSLLDVDDLAEAQHDRLLALVDDEDRRIEQEQDDGGDDADDGETVAHWLLPSGRRRRAFLQLGQRQIGHDTLARCPARRSPCCESFRTFSMVSRYSRLRVTSGALAYSL